MTSVKIVELFRPYPMPVYRMSLTCLFFFRYLGGAVIRPSPSVLRWLRPSSVRGLKLFRTQTQCCVKCPIAIAVSQMQDDTNAEFFHVYYPSPPPHFTTRAITTLCYRLSSRRGGGVGTGPKSKPTLNQSCDREFTSQPSLCPHGTSFDL